MSIYFNFNVDKHVHNIKSIIKNGKMSGELLDSWICMPLVYIDQLSVMISCAMILRRFRIGCVKILVGKELMIGNDC